MPARKKATKKKEKKIIAIQRIYILPVLVGLFLTVFTIFKPFQSEPTPALACANSISCIKDLSGAYKSKETSGVFMGKSVTAPSEIAQSSPLPSVLGDSTATKRIYVDLSAQRLYAFEGSNMVYQFPVSTGKWGRTPTGTFRIWIKLRYTRMTGGNPAIGTFYDLPNVPYTMFFYNNEVSQGAGYSLHGAYWHNNFGHPMSHGCVNMRIEDAHQLFDWANPPTAGYTTYASSQNPGTEVVVYGVAPTE